MVSPNVSVVVGGGGGGGGGAGAGCMTSSPGSISVSSSPAQATAVTRDAATSTLRNERFIPTSDEDLCVRPGARRDRRKLDRRRPPPNLAPPRSVATGVMQVPCRNASDGSEELQSGLPSSGFSLGAEGACEKSASLARPRGRHGAAPRRQRRRSRN